MNLKDFCEKHLFLHVNGHKYLKNVIFSSKTPKNVLKAFANWRTYANI